MTTLHATAQNQLRQYIEQIERLEEDKRALGDDIKDKYAEAKANGFDVKVMRKVVQLRKKSETEREEEQSILDLYMHAMGMEGTPLDNWANDKADVTVTVHQKQKAPKARLRGSRVSLPESPSSPTPIGAA